MSGNEMMVQASASGSEIVQTSTGPVDTSGIVGWGADANPQNDPTYPYRDRSTDDHSGKWTRPSQQQPKVEVLQSIEHVRLPAVFGTSSPPRWLSGAMRRLAFTRSESNWAHWLLLMGADRVNMLEGLLQDFAQAKVPNIPKEMGIRAEWQHNKKGLAIKIGVAAVAGGAIFAWSRSRPSRKSDHSSGTPARPDKAA